MKHLCCIRQRLRLLVPPSCEPQRVGMASVVEPYMSHTVPAGALTRRGRKVDTNAPFTRVALGSARLALGTPSDFNFLTPSQMKQRPAASTARSLSSTAGLHVAKLSSTSGRQRTGLEFAMLPTSSAPSTTQGARLNVGTSQALSSSSHPRNLARLTSNENTEPDH